MVLVLCLASLASVIASLPVAAQVLLDPATQPRFVNPLPVPPVIDATAGGTFTVDMTQFQQHLGLFDPVTGAPLMTTVWGYDGSYPGPTFVVRKDVPVDVLWRNQLFEVDGVTPLAHLLPVDTSLHWAAPQGWPQSGVPAVVHLHGGHTESASDGLPDAWFTPGFAQTGHGFVKQTLHYDNDQEAATIWYHDHALGITRLNVYAGLAGFYLVRDENEDALLAAGSLPAAPYDLGLAIQDRLFTADGQLHYPALPPTPTAPSPSVLPEFFGNVILVNGMAWPVLDVEPRQYRFRFLNGSDSRFYNLNLVEGPNATDALPLALPPAMWQIGTDNGLLNAPVQLRRLLMGPGERAEVVIDFSDPAFNGRTFILRNNAKSPFPNGATANPQNEGQIMMFRVSLPLNPEYPLTPLPADLRPVHGPIQPLVATPGVMPRQLILAEMMDQYGRMMPMLGTTAAGALMWDDPITENPMLGDTEIWEVYNTTPDAHPVHLHLVTFQILDRQKYSATVDPMTGALAGIRLKGRPTPPAPEEKGWKDTAIMYPGERTRVIAHFDREGLYVWHCHILSHEDHEMMRPFYVGEMPGGGHGGMHATGPQTPAGATSTDGVELAPNAPNPFNPMTQINFRLPKADHVSLRVYDVRGRLIRTLADGAFDAGRHSVTWDGRDEGGTPAASGVYFYELRAGDQVARNRMTLTK